MADYIISLILNGVVWVLGIAFLALAGWVLNLVAGEVIKYWWLSIFRRRYRNPIEHFVLPEDYYAPYLGEDGKKKAITHEVDCIARDKELGEIVNAVDQGSINVFLVTAPPGYGKSRLALELARRLSGKGYGFKEKVIRAFQRKLWLVYFVQNYTKNILENVEELRKKKRIAIFLDNAHESPDLVRALCAYASVSGSEGRLLLFCFARTSSSNLVIDALSSVPPDEVGEFPLSKLKESDVANIVSKLIPKELETTKKQIVKFTKDSIFLTVLVCQLIKRGENFSDKITESSFKRRICDAPLEEATAPCGIAFNKISRALAVIAAASPISTQDKKLKSIALKLGEVSSNEYDCLFEKIQESGLFSIYAGDILKPTPDLIGDLVLDSVCLKDDRTVTAFVDELMSELIGGYGKRVLNNLADLGWTIGGEDSVDVISPVLHQAASDVSGLSLEDIRGVVDWSGPLSRRRAKEVVAIVERIWERFKVEVGKGGTHDEDWRRLMGDTVPILVASAHEGEALEAAMSLLKEVLINDAAHTPYDNHKPDSGLKEVVSFSPYHSISHTSSALSVIESWYDIGGKDAVVALHSIADVVSPVVHWTESEAFQLSYISRVISPSEDVREIRGRAINLMIAGLNSSDIMVQGAAFEVVDSIGQYRYGADYDEGSDIAELINDEKITVVSALDKAMEGDVSLSMLRGIENRLWNWWCFSADSVASACEDLLSKIEGTPGYRLSKIIFAEDLPIDMNIEVARQRGDVSRSEYYFDVNRAEKERTIDALICLLQEFGIEDDPSKWKDKIEEVSEGNRKVSWRACHLFYSLALKYPLTGWDMLSISGEEVWDGCRSSLLHGLKENDKSLWEKELNKFSEEQPMDPTMAVNWLDTLDWREGLDEFQWSVVDRVITNPEKNLQSYLANKLAHGSKEDWSKAVRRLLKIASENTQEEKIVDYLFSRLSRKRPENIKESLGGLDKEAIEYLEREDLGNYIPWDRPYWVGEYLGVVARIDADRFIDFIETTLGNTKDSLREVQFQILGAKNAEKAFRLLTDSDLKKAHLRKFVTWAATDGVLGNFSGSALSSLIAVNDRDVIDELNRLYKLGDLEKVATILSRYSLKKEWLVEVKRLLIKADKKGAGMFDRVTKKVGVGYWAGTTTRTPGQPAERDKICSEMCGKYEKDMNLSPRVRAYFRDQRTAAEQSIRKDIAGDEALAGGSLS